MSAMTVSELVEALRALPLEQQGYEVWAESDPSGPIDQPQHWWFDHDRRIIHI